MRLYLVQHGEACAKEVDSERPLTNQGKDDVDHLATYLKQAGIQVQRVIHSGKLRAQQTAKRLAEAIAPHVELEISEFINPNDSPTVFVPQCENMDMDSLIVGHLPFMAKLLSQLVIEDEDREVVAFQPGTMVCLEAEQGLWHINWMLRPELLR